MLMEGKCMQIFYILLSFLLEILFAIIICSTFASNYRKWSVNFMNSLLFKILLTFFRTQKYSRKFHLEQKFSFMMLSFVNLAGSFCRVIVSCWWKSLTEILRQRVRFLTSTILSTANNTQTVFAKFFISFTGNLFCT